MLQRHHEADGSDYLLKSQQSTFPFKRPLGALFVYKNRIGESAPPLAKCCIGLFGVQWVGCQVGFTLGACIKIYRPVVFFYLSNAAVKTIIYILYRMYNFNNKYQFGTSALVMLQQLAKHTTLSHFFALSLLLCCFWEGEVPNYYLLFKLSILSRIQIISFTSALAYK